MKRKWKIAIVATVVLLLARTLVFAQTGSSPKTGEQGSPFNPDESVWCGRGGFGSGDCGGQGGYNGSPDDGGDGFSCH
jgi:hypothetical protein